MGRRLKSIKVENKNEEVTIDITEIGRTIRDCHKPLYANKMDNLEEMDKFLERSNLPRLNQDETENMHRPITRNKIVTVL